MPLESCTRDKPKTLKSIINRTKFRKAKDNTEKRKIWETNCLITFPRCFSFTVIKSIMKNNPKMNSVTKLQPLNRLSQSCKRQYRSESKNWL